MTEAVFRQILSKVEKPARYTGGEYNTPFMKQDAWRVCLCFPDIYEVGMSNLGVKILYHLLNEQSDICCERCFAPWQDMLKELNAAKEPLFSLETKRPLKDFDLIGFSLQYELCYTNVLMMLEAGGIPLRAADRGEDFPIVMAGGPCTFNVEPMADFFDVVMIGDGEEHLLELTRLYGECKKQGVGKAEYLRRAQEIEGVYVPSFMQVTYRDDGNIDQMTPEKPIRRAVIADLDQAYFPTKQLVPNIETVHNRGVIELFRGCSRGCRFCQACFTYRPIRERKSETLVEMSRRLVEATGFDEVSMSSLSTGDYTRLKELVCGVTALADELHVHFALPSLRADTFDGDFTDNSRKSSLTFAPEAGSQRLRDVINKNIFEQDVVSAVSEAFERGYATVKLYFMMGLPTETDEDVAAIATLAKEVENLFYKHRHTKKQLTVSVSCNVFVPKPFTPFQWEAFESAENVRRKQDILRTALKGRAFRFSYSDYKTAELEAVFARGDRRLSHVIERAYRLGAIFDSWTECFDPARYEQAFADCGLQIDFYTRARDIALPLPWEFFDAGVQRSYFLREREKAYQGVTTGDCRKNCAACGAGKEGKCQALNAQKGK